jgi:hypothetical protein
MNCFPLFAIHDFLMWNRIGDPSMINELAGAVLDGIVENLPTALIMAGLAAAAALLARRRSRKRKENRKKEHSKGW